MRWVAWSNAGTELLSGDSQILYMQMASCLASMTLISGIRETAKFIVKLITYLHNIFSRCSFIRISLS